MGIVVTCDCGAIFQVTEAHAGKRGKCPYCQAVIQLPLLETSAKPPVIRPVFRVESPKTPPIQPPPICNSSNNVYGTWLSISTSFKSLLNYLFHRLRVSNSHYPRYAATACGIFLLMALAFYWGSNANQTDLGRESIPADNGSTAKTNPSSSDDTVGPAKGKQLITFGEDEELIRDLGGAQSPYAFVASSGAAGAPPQDKQQHVLLVDEYKALRELLARKKPAPPPGMIYNDNGTLINKEGLLDKTIDVGANILDRAFTYGTGVGLNSSGRVSSVSLSGDYHTDEKLELLKKLQQLESLDLSRVDSDSITDRGLQSISNMHSLKVLDLHGLKISEEAAFYLKGLRQLQDLNMSNTRLTDRGVSYLAEIKTLIKLDITGTKVTDACAPYIGGMENLEILKLYGENNVNPKNAYKHFGRLKKLHNQSMLTYHRAGFNQTQNYLYDITGSFLNDGYNLLSKDTAEKEYSDYELRSYTSGAMVFRRPVGTGKELLQVIDGMHHFKTLDFRLFPCTDDDMRVIAKFHKCEYLNLAGSKVTAAGLKFLSTMPQLKYLDLTATSVAKADLLALSSFSRITDVRVDLCDLDSATISEIEKAIPRIAIHGNTLADHPAGSRDFLVQSLRLQKPEQKE